MSKNEKDPVLAVAEASSQNVAKPRTFTRGKVVTRTVFKLDKDKPAILRIDSVMKLGKQLPGKVDPATGEMVMPKPAMTCDVQAMESDVPHVLLCNSVLRSELVEHYKDDSYVGKIFEITNLGKLPGRDYNGYAIVEMTLDA